MAEIDTSNPLTPVWPQRPIRRIEQEGESAEEKRRRQQKRQKDNDDDNNNNDNDDGKPHIDEYV